MPEPEASGPIVYRLGRDPFKVERRVRFPLGLSRRVALGVEVVRQWMWSWGCSSAWLECRSVTPEVAGSSPVSPVEKKGNGEPGTEAPHGDTVPGSLIPVPAIALVVKLVDTPS